MTSSYVSYRTESKEFLMEISQESKQLIEKANEYQLKLCIGYIDSKKAFDSVEHDLFAALRKIGVNEGYVKIIEDIHKCNSDNPHRQ